MKSSFRPIPIIACILIALIQPLPAATDAELSQVAQLIQQGKNTEAKAALNKLTEREPNNSTLLSLQRQIGVVSSNSSPDRAPSIEETMQFIESKINGYVYSPSATGRGGTIYGNYKIIKAEYKSGKPTVSTQQHNELG